VDVRIQLARENHQLAERSEATAKLHRQQRDRLVRQLRAEDPDKWSLKKLAVHIGCSKGLIAAILRTGSSETV
jgi:AraC-like DNA-binding protein